jgi:DNA-binding transcriptional LysR family regulator
MPTTRQLELFITVADCGSMRRAADVLNISQPVISKQIKALERSIGGELILRTRGGRAELSVLGRALLQDARATLELQRRLTRRESVGTVTLPRIYVRELQLGKIKSILPDLFAAGLPRDTAFLACGDPLAALDSDSARQSAFALFGSVRIPVRTEYISHVVAEQHGSFFAAPALARDLAAGMQKLADVICLMPSGAPQLTQWLDETMRKAGLDPANRRQVPGSLDSLVEAVRSGKGVAVLMNMHVEDLVESGELVPITAVSRPLLLILMADPSCDLEVYEAVCRALHVLNVPPLKL